MLVFVIFGFSLQNLQCFRSWSGLLCTAFGFSKYSALFFAKWEQRPVVYVCTANGSLRFSGDRIVIIILITWSWSVNHKPALSKLLLALRKQFRTHHHHFTEESRKRDLFLWPLKFWTVPWLTVCICYIIPVFLFWFRLFEGWGVFYVTLFCSENEFCYCCCSGPALKWWVGRRFRLGVGVGQNQHNMYCFPRWPAMQPVCDNLMFSWFSMQHFTLRWSQSFALQSQSTVISLSLYARTLYRRSSNMHTRARFLNALYYTLRTNADICVPFIFALLHRRGI